MLQTGDQKVTRNGCTSARARFAAPDASQAGPSHMCYARDPELARTVRRGAKRAAASFVAPRSSPITAMRPYFSPPKPGVRVLCAWVINAEVTRHSRASGQRARGRASAGVPHRRLSKGPRSGGSIPAP